MTNRSISAIVFGSILFIELVMFISLPAITKQVENGNHKGLFSGYDTVSDYAATQNRNTKYIIIIGATAVIGSIVTFAQSNTKK